jgi:hypothetical protein
VYDRVGAEGDLGDLAVEGEFGEERSIGDGVERTAGGWITNGVGWWGVDSIEQILVSVGTV